MLFAVESINESCHQGILGLVEKVRLKHKLASSREALRKGQVRGALGEFRDEKAGNSRAFRGQAPIMGRASRRPQILHRPWVSYAQGQPWGDAGTSTPVGEPP